MTQIVIGDDEFIDQMDKIHQTPEGVVCCGQMMQLVSHVDGKDYSSSSYKCDCGNVICVRSKRTGNNAMMWESEELEDG